MKDPVIENSGSQIMVDPIPDDIGIHIYQSKKGADKPSGGDTGSGEGQSGSSSTELKEVFNSIKDSPNYPEGFQSRANGTTNNKVNNQQLLEKLREIESGTWKKIYKDGCDAYENKISIHYFQSQSGKVFDVKVKSGWSN